MANAKLQQFDDFKKFVAMFPGLFKISEDLAEIGSLEQACKEAENRLEALKAEEASSRGRAKEIVAKAEAAAVETEKQASVNAGIAAARADGVIHEAKRQAAALIAQAEADARMATEKERARLDAVNAQIATRLSELEELHDHVADKTNELADLRAAIQQAAAHRAQLQQHIADIKAKFA